MRRVTTLSLSFLLGSLGASATPTAGHPTPTLPDSDGPRSSAARHQGVRILDHAALSRVVPMLPATPGELSEALAREIFRSPAWRAVDPELEAAQGLQVRVRRFGKRVVARATPLIEGVPVEGADRVLVVQGRRLRAELRATLQPRGAFRLTPEQATAQAASHVPGALFVDATVERVGGFARPLWLAEAGGLRAAYRVRVPTLALRELSDVWVDAQSGQILRRERVARLIDLPDGGPGNDTDGGGADVDAGTPDAGDTEGGTADAGPGDATSDAGSGDAGSGDAGSSDAGGGGGGEPSLPAPSAARVFRFAPSPSGANAADLVDVTLPALRPAPAGEYLRGDFVETYNCCKEYVCADGSATCEGESRVCAEDSDENPIASVLNVEIPAALLPAPLNTQPLYARTAFCAELPRVRSTTSGWSANPVDQPRGQNALAGLASEEDAFAELQVYYTTMSFLDHLREVLEDASFCLGGDSMQCDEEGQPLLSDDGDPLRPFHIAVNVMLPELDFQAVINQVLAGKGRTPGDPIIIDDYQRLDNAAFVPALEGGPIQVPPELAPLLSVFNRPYDSNIYFQGARDFAYDGDVVAHEFTHAVVHSFVPTLRSSSRDAYGAHVDPGAMNEGWSDYFSASFMNDSRTGEYGAVGITGGELGLRDANNDKRCPEDLIGQVHGDSEVFSGALWRIRTTLGDDASRIAMLDQTLLAALAESADEETMAMQAERIIAALADTMGSDMADTARAAFETHNLLACERVIPLATLGEDGEATPQSKALLFVPGADEIGTDAIAPAPLQFRIEVPKGASGFTLQWQQAAGGGFAGLGQAEAPEPLRVLTREDTRAIRWEYEGPGGRAPQPYDAEGTPLTFDPSEARFQSVLGAADNAGNATARFEVALEPDPCAPRTWVAQLVNADSGTQVNDVRVDFTMSEASCPEPQTPADAGPDASAPPAACGCDAAPAGGGPGLALGWLAAALCGVIGVRRRRD